MLPIIGLWYAGINTAAVCLFWWDKFRAKTNGWRVPEKTLQLSALLGGNHFNIGWIGGMWAMEQFRHKTKKESFRTPYFICTGLNVAALGYYLKKLVK